MLAVIATIASALIINMSCNQDSDKVNLENALADVKVVAKGKFSDTDTIICQRISQPLPKPLDLGKSTARKTSSRLPMIPSCIQLIDQD